MIYLGKSFLALIRLVPYLFFLALQPIALTSCTATEEGGPGMKKSVNLAVPPAPAAAAEILAKPEVPILCYHQLRDYRTKDSETAKDYIVPPARFAEQMRRLADSGYHTILPDDLHDYLLYGKALPPRPVMLTFDDTDLEQFTVGAAEMDKYGFKGVFFIMTVSLDRPGYMSREQVKALADAGHVIGSHTWDHHNVKKYVPEDWVRQVDKPSRELKAITGKPVEYFAYPFGLWDETAAEEIARRGFKSAFQLSEKRHPELPMMTIRRIIIPGRWDADKMLQRMQQSFH